MKTIKNGITDWQITIVGILVAVLQLFLESYSEVDFTWKDYIITASIMVLGYFAKNPTSKDEKENKDI